MEEKARRVFERGSLAAVCGASFGGLLAAFRPGASIPFYMLSMGTNYAIVGYSYFGFLELYKDLDIKVPELPVEYKKYESYTGTTDQHVPHILSGLSTGAIWCTLFAGPRKGILGSILFGTVGLAGSLAHVKFNEWRVSKGKQMLAERERFESTETKK